MDGEKGGERESFSGTSEAEGCKAAHKSSATGEEGWRGKIKESLYKNKSRLK